MDPGRFYGEQRYRDRNMNPGAAPDHLAEQDNGRHG